MTLTVASFSGGKDSTAMVVRMIEIGDKLDQVVFCDTGLEFPAMYDHIAKVKEHVESQGVEFVTLAPDRPFREYLLDYPRHSQKYGDYLGYGWPSMKIRWCTKHLKIQAMEHYRRELREANGEDIVTCTGLAADEARRLERVQNSRDRHPLAEWGWTEDMALGYCYGKGYDWHDPSTGKGLYDVFDRTSCWICPLASLENKRRLRRWYPDLWAEIGRMEREMRARREGEGKFNRNAWAYTPRATWQELEDRFAREDRGIDCKSLEDYL